jgi:hypothetical protein
MRSFFPPHIILGLGKQRDLGNKICQTVGDKSNSKRLSISFLNAMNRDFGTKIPSAVSLNGYLNIAIFYSKFFAIQK